MISEHVKSGLREMTLEANTYVDNKKIDKLAEFMAQDNEGPLDDNDEIAKYQALESLNKVITKAEELEMTDAELLFAIVIMQEEYAE